MTLLIVFVLIIVASHLKTLIKIGKPFIFCFLLCAPSSPSGACWISSYFVIKGNLSAIVWQSQGSVHVGGHVLRHLPLIPTGPSGPPGWEAEPPEHPSRTPGPSGPPPLNALRALRALRTPWWCGLRSGVQVCVSVCSQLGLNQQPLVSQPDA